ncbi:hypothetical protein MiSe_72300 [Microseira wollei NIES-4236]|uniref:Uncharacterized protein n=1 Tax=Microseira wollei NIES-4236 TaxID=2530354 RepID=A0AAV3XIG3_9CYAN|nr:hypothetical protein MiSe_72300 [Microseira wollei NIES-4236]
MQVLRSHRLNKLKYTDDAKEDVYKPILTLVKNRLCSESYFRNEIALAEQLNQILLLLEGKSALELGYATDNFQNLILQL